MFVTPIVEDTRGLEEMVEESAWMGRYGFNRLGAQDGLLASLSAWRAGLGEIGIRVSGLDSRISQVPVALEQMKDTIFGVEQKLARN